MSDTDTSEYERRARAIQAANQPVLNTLRSGLSNQD